MPNAFASFSFESREFSGRTAGVGYEAVGMPLITGLSGRIELRKISCAKPAHEVDPAAVRWYMPDLLSQSS